jgi:hypothetical protein
MINAVPQIASGTNPLLPPVGGRQVFSMDRFRELFENPLDTHERSC